MTLNEGGTADPDPVRYALRLFVAGTTAHSLRAIRNLRRICDAHLAGRVELEVVDIYQQPELAEAHQVVAVPTLLRLRPLPQRLIIGDLSDQGRVMRSLDLPATQSDADALG